MDLLMKHIVMWLNAGGRLITARQVKMFGEAILQIQNVRSQCHSVMLRREDGI